MLPFMNNKSHDPRRPHESLSPQGSARLKVEQDIAFLSDRIKAMQQQPRPNAMLIEHYQSMLRSREAVLKWLLDGCDDETSSQRSHTS